MKVFKDSEGRDWTIAINVAAVNRVRDLTQVNLYDIGSDQLADSLANDLEKVVNVIYAIVKPDADKKQITDEQFGAALGGDALDAAISAFTEELIDFFPSHRRKLLRAAANKGAELQEQLLTMGLQKINDINAEQLLQEMQKRTSTNSPESSASIPPT